MRTGQDPQGQRRGCGRALAGRVPGGDLRAAGRGEPAGGPHPGRGGQHRVHLAAQHEPAEALAAWLQRFAVFIGTKRGLGAALHSGDRAYDSLPDYFQQRFVPVLGALLDTAARAGEIRADIGPDDLLRATGNLAMPAHDDGEGHTRRMVALLVDGLRYGAPPRRD
ncbi:hypothetical protein [Streptomyces sp. NBC_01438]|uniref:SbtR family transcriptional regulator n=1 Tax=Streptomyces sp. NBC_01438 TaxID=2903866 RepID=UPI00352C36FF